MRFIFKNLLSKKCNYSTFVLELNKPKPRMIRKIPWNIKSNFKLEVVPPVRTKAVESGWSRVSSISGISGFVIKIESSMTIRELWLDDEMLISKICVGVPDWLEEIEFCELVEEIAKAEDWLDWELLDNVEMELDGLAAELCDKLCWLDCDEMDDKELEVWLESTEENWLEIEFCDPALELVDELRLEIEEEIKLELLLLELREDFEEEVLEELDFEEERAELEVEVVEETEVCEELELGSFGIIKEYDWTGEFQKETIEAKPKKTKLALNKFNENFETIKLSYKKSTLTKEKSIWNVV
jgi:hypothetical protein